MISLTDKSCRGLVEKEKIMYWVNVFDGRWPQLDVINTLRKRSILMAQPVDQWKYEKYE